MGEAPIVRIARWFGTREDRPIRCRYGTNPQHMHEARCTRMITLLESDAAGHRGFCSIEHSELDQDERVI